MSATTLSRRNAPSHKWPFSSPTLPLELLHAELLRRQDADFKPSCGTTGNRGSYNTPIHVFAVFLILGLSTLACSFPIIARRFPNLPIPHRFLFVSRHFGTGVLLATAFIHLLPTAFVSMTDPCLPSFWNKGYPAMAGLIAMTAVLAVVTVEMKLSTSGAGHSHGGEWDIVSDGATRRVSLRGGDILRPNSRQANGHIPLGGIGLTSEHSSYMDSTPKEPHDHDRDEADEPDELDDLEALDPLAEESYLSQPSSHKRQPSYQGHPIQDQNPQKLFIQCLLLEAGILFHSIFIGMAVSVATGTQFVVLLVAICFHQTFEGFALGARIAALIPDLFTPSSPKPWLMALAYGMTTPVGQVLGLLLHRVYDPASVAGLLSVGITNAISSGLLLFAGLVQLIAEDFLSERSYEVLRGKRRIEACLSVACGGVLMAIVGAFA